MVKPKRKKIKKYTDGAKIPSLNSRGIPDNNASLKRGDFGVPQLPNTLSTVDPGIVKSVRNPGTASAGSGVPATLVAEAPLLINSSVKAIKGFKTSANAKTGVSPEDEAQAKIKAITTPISDVSGAVLSGVTGGLIPASVASKIGDASIGLQVNLARKALKSLIPGLRKRANEKRREFASQTQAIKSNRANEESRRNNVSVPVHQNKTFFSKDGGKLRIFKQGGAVILSGQGHDEGGNSIVDQKGNKVAETESKELLLTLDQTTIIEKLRDRFNANSDDADLIEIGKVMKNIIKFDTVDNSGEVFDG